MLVSSAVRTVTNLFWILYFKLVPLNHSHKLLHRQNIFAADIYAPKKRNVSLHPSTLTIAYSPLHVFKSLCADLRTNKAQLCKTRSHAPKCLEEEFSEVRRSNRPIGPGSRHSRAA